MPYVQLLDNFRLVEASTEDIVYIKVELNGPPGKVTDAFVKLAGALKVECDECDPTGGQRKASALAVSNLSLALQERMQAMFNGKAKLVYALPDNIPETCNQQARLAERHLLVYAKQGNDLDL